MSDLHERLSSALSERYELDREIGRGGMAVVYLARIHESMGEPAQAAEQYARFVEMWRDADPELQPIVEEARAAVRRLAPDGGPSE